MHKWLKIILFLFFAITIVVILIILFRDKLLLDHSSKVANTSGWELNWRSYSWLDDDRILFFQFNSQSGWQPLCQYVKTGHITYLPQLAKKLAHTLDKHSQVEVSPDGKWLIWTDANKYVFATQVEGSNFFPWKVPVPCRIIWMSDSTHVVILSENLNRSLYNKISKYYIDSVRCHHESDSEMNNLLRIDNINPYDIVVFPNGHLITETSTEDISETKKSMTVGVVDVNITNNKSIITNINFPAQGHLIEMGISPNGQSLVWELESKHRSFFSKLVHRVFPIFRVQTRSVISLWVSKLDGSNMQEIGHVLLDNNTDYMNLVHHVRWLSGGRKISFIYQNSLYIVPID